MTFPRPPFPLAWLPNQHGYEFIGVKRDGSRVECRVEKRPDGLHTVAGGLFPDLVGWFFKSKPKKVEGAA